MGKRTQVSIELGFRPEGLDQCDRGQFYLRLVELDPADMTATAYGRKRT